MNQIAQQIEIIREPRERSIQPGKFILWLFMVTIVMLFAAMTSAYVVKQGEGGWLQFRLPDIFWLNSGIILVSSVFMQLAYVSARRDHIRAIRSFLILTLLFGFGFLIGQYLSWEDLVAQDVFFVGNPAGSFLYVLTGLHAFHLITGILFLIIVLYSSFKYQVHARNMSRIELATIYWHFLGGLWFYLFLFLKINQ